MKDHEPTSHKSLEDMSQEELGRLFPVEIIEANPQWPLLFEAEKECLKDLLGSRVADIAHFGSTAVPGLAAKPCIDMLVEITKEDPAYKDELRALLTSQDYHYIPREDSPPPYMMFAKGYTPLGYKGQCYHLHVAPKTHLGLWDRLYFRDYLIAHREAAEEYELLKRVLAQKHPHHRERYTEAKTEFVKHITSLALAQNRD